VAVGAAAPVRQWWQSRFDLVIRDRGGEAARVNVNKEERRQRGYQRQDKHRGL
jgi:hypothetical protein